MLDWLQARSWSRYRHAYAISMPRGAAGEQGEYHQPEMRMSDFPCAPGCLGGPQKCSRFLAPLSIAGWHLRARLCSCEHLAAPHRLCWKRLKEKSQLIYNLGNGQGFSVRDSDRALVQSTTGPGGPAARFAARPVIAVAALRTSVDQLRARLKPAHSQVVDEL